MLAAAEVLRPGRKVARVRTVEDLTEVLKVARATGWHPVLLHQGTWGLDVVLELRVDRPHRAEAG